MITTDFHKNGGRTASLFLPVARLVLHGLRPFLGRRSVCKVAMHLITLMGARTVCKPALYVWRDVPGTLADLKSGGKTEHERTDDREGEDEAFIFHNFF